MNALQDTNLRRAPEGMRWTRERTLTKRTVIWPGYMCDLRCVFCYNDGMDKDWRPFSGKGGLKEEVEKKRLRYHNRYIDFMGGEPTLHPEIVDILRYCRSISIKPTLITHALALSNQRYLARLRMAGVEDFLVSVHGIGETADRIFNVGKKDLFNRQLRAISNINEAGIRFRVNTTLIRWNKEELEKIAALAVEHEALALNFIMFNPHFAWARRTAIEFQARYSEIAPFLKKAIDICARNGIEVNVRYFPFCQLQGYEKHIYNCTQLPYDHHEWDYNSWHDLGAQNPGKDWYYREGKRQAERNGNVKGDTCMNCALRHICDGFQGQYVYRYGFDEAVPFTGTDEIHDPIAFIGDQWKIEEID
jgi:MoaA/NifB/PqqE/SkfB family radical SAM enzyme